MAEKNARLLDKRIHELLSNGVRVVTGTNGDGTPIIETVSMSAAMVNAVRLRVKDQYEGKSTDRPEFASLEEEAAARIRLGLIRSDWAGGPEPSSPAAPAPDEDGD